MTNDTVLKRLFALANRLAQREIASGYSGIAEVKGSVSWSFLEHLTELPDKGRGELLHALIKRRFIMEGLRLPEMSLSAGEELEIAHWLKHNNSMHGTRHVPFFAFSTREEEFISRKTHLSLASRKDIRAALRSGLEAASVSIRIAQDRAQEVSWYTSLPNGFRVKGWVDLGKSGEQAASFVAVYGTAAKSPEHIPTSFLGILGIGESSWRFLEQGQESLFSASTIRFFGEVCSTMAQ